MRRCFSFSLLAIAALSVFTRAAIAQSVQVLANQPPLGVLISFQLTDGTVLAQSLLDNGRWYKLTPDINGSYVNGVWSEMKSMPIGYAPNAFASAVLADGRLVTVGGEYNYSQFDLTNKGAIYDPIANSWTMLSPPQGWNYIGDSPSIVLPDGRFLVGDKLHKWLAALDPKTLTWSAFASTGKNDFNAEEGWTLLPDGSILTVDIKDGPKAERYLPAKQVWRSAGNALPGLVEKTYGVKLRYGHALIYHPPGEIGPAILRPDGTVFATGAFSDYGYTGSTDIYTPPSKGNPTGTWTRGPVFPNGNAAGDAPAVLLPNGNVLVEDDGGNLYEFDGTSLIAESVTPTHGFLMVLPTGSALIGGGGGMVEIYTSTGNFQTSWAPTVTKYPTSVARGTTYQIFGTQFNGLSQANAVGDELQTATNYPLVRITNMTTNHVFYARTHDHSTMGVATGSKPAFTYFDVPSNMETGASSLEVIANGIPSTPVSIAVN
jgi:hypothetical protein